MPSPAAPRACFVIPTYSEAANITPLLERVTALYPGSDTAVLVVDDHSPDGTGGLVRTFAARRAKPAEDETARLARQTRS